MKLSQVREVLTGQGLPRYDAPPDIKGRPRPDRAMRITEAVTAKYLRVLTAYEYDPGVAGHNPDVAMKMVVSQRDVVARDENVVQLRFEAEDGAELPAWQPGSHLDFHLPSGLRRQYSLCGDPADRMGYSVAVRRIPDGGGGSLEMHALEPGAPVTVRGPRNGFPFVGEGSALFVAGGIGITPILAMVRAARELGMDWQFVYSGRSRESMPFLDEIETFDRSRVFIRPDDEFGLPTAEELLGRAAPGGAVYCCGPTPMLESVRRAFPGSPATALHFERFGAPPVLDGTEFEVQLVSTGEVLTVPADESALTVIKKTMSGVGYSCQQGFCGTCRVKVLSGTPDHRETRLTDAEQENEMLICVSRADRGRLVLDL
ncbi:phthalate 4,5-dioxygenase [Rhodococcus opacus M213]|uniref:Phthalate 4,5-dioxygenase n=1 Tax=Rhodococcus opacus M213 TaxID=1129896 RepID=K8XAK1_RHOOP|nr:PDR/VanB family oxidoreductase [Rhodococcus opacus]EKT77876.1 phthalate 4,5-dioxygenase [Rhodococcus opacus M213]